MRNNTVSFRPDKKLKVKSNVYVMTVLGLICAVFVDNRINLDVSYVFISTGALLHVINRLKQSSAEIKIISIKDEMIFFTFQTLSSNRISRKTDSFRYSIKFNDVEIFTKEGGSFIGRATGRNADNLEKWSDILLDLKKYEEN